MKNLSCTLSSATTSKKMKKSAGHPCISHGNRVNRCILSPTYAVKLMQEYLELIPAVKISGFGGDFCNAEGAFGHWQIAGENIAQAIANMIEEGWYSLDYGKQLVKQILYDNPKAIYHL